MVVNKELLSCNNFGIGLLMAKVLELLMSGDAQVEIVISATTSMIQL